MYSNPIQYTKIPNEVIFDTNLSSTELRVYLALCTFDVNETGIVNNLKYEKLGELVGLSRPRVKQVVNNLVEKGYVVKHTYEQLKANGKIVYNGTRNEYILPKKIIHNRLLKLSTKVENPSSEDEKKPLDNDILSTEEDKKETPINSSDNIDDDNIDKHIEQEIDKLKQEKGEDIVGRALAKMGKFSIQKSGFITYLKKVIHTINSNSKCTYKNTYEFSNFIHKKSSKPSTFNNFKHRNYNWDMLQGALLGWNNAELKDCMIE